MHLLWVGEPSSSIPANVHSGQGVITPPRNWDQLTTFQRAQWFESIPGQRGFYPWLGICGSVLGTLFAVSAVPEHPAAQGALRIPAIGLAIGLIIGPLLAGIANPRNFIRTENILGVTPAYWLLLDLIQGVAPMPGINVIGTQTSFAMIGVCTAFFWLGTLGKPWPMPKSFVQSCSIRPPIWALFTLIVVLFCLAMLSYAIPCKFDIGLMFDSLGKGRWSAPWTRGRLGDWDAFRDHLAYFGYLLPAFATMLARRRGWLHPLSICAVLMAVIFLAFLAQGGARRLVGATLGAAVCYWVLDRPKVKFLQIALAGLAVVAILWVMQVMIYARNEGLDEGGAAAVRIALANIEGKKFNSDQFDYIRVDDNFYRITNIAMDIPDKHDWIYFDYMYYVIIRPIPRVLWPEKPIDPGYAITLMSAQGTLLSCTILGEFWMSWGYGALAIGGWLLGKAARLNFVFYRSATGSLAPLFYGYMTMWLFVGYRSLLEIVLFTYPLIMWMAIAFLLRGTLSRAR